MKKLKGKMGILVNFLLLLPFFKKKKKKKKLVAKTTSFWAGWEDEMVKKLRGKMDNSVNFCHMRGMCEGFC